MKAIFDYYGILIFSILIIILSVLFLCFHTFYKNILNRLFIIKNSNESTLFFFSILFIYITVVYILSYCKKHIYNQSLVYYQNYEERPLYDTLHSIIPYNQYSIYFSEIIMIFFVLLIIYLFYKKRNISIFYNFIILLALIQLIRSLLFSLTLLPDSSNKCTFSIMVGSCNDLLFSGHISGALLILLFVYKYQLFKSKMMKHILIALFILMNIFILSSRNHYSIDIIIGIIVTYVIYTFYFLRGEKMLIKCFN